jgi:hypothetical protein
VWCEVIPTLPFCLTAKLCTSVCGLDVNGGPGSWVHTHLFRTLTSFRCARFSPSAPYTEAPILATVRGRLHRPQVAVVIVCFTAVSTSCPLLLKYMFVMLHNKGTMYCYCHMQLYYPIYSNASGCCPLSVVRRAPNWGADGLKALPSKKLKLKKYRFCKHDVMSHFTWFTFSRNVPLR